MPNHWRRCWDCENLAVHADNVVPHVLCTKCGSQDTRALKLKPCPFCGQAATIQKGGEHNGKSYFSVGCADYKCRGCHGTCAAPEEKMREEISAWNKRAKDTVSA